MKGKVALLLSITLLLVGAAAVPVFACPAHGTFTQGIAHITVDPGKQWMTGNVQHIRNSVGADYICGGPWGNSITSTVTENLDLNIVTFVGSASGHSLDTYVAGKVEGTLIMKFNGIGSFTYNGPTFTFSQGGTTIIATHGATYIGPTFTGLAIKHGISGSLKGTWTFETSTGISLGAGIALIDNTVTYTTHD